MDSDMKKVCIFGVGSLGANTAINLARVFENNITFIFIDYDRIENVNLANQPWYDINIGQHKSSVLSAYVYRVAKCVSIPIICKIEDVDDFIRKEHKSLKGVDLFIDCFDNLPSRRLTESIANKQKIPILHSGFTDTLMMCKWGNEFPLKVRSKNTAPICNRRELGSLITLGASVTSLVATNFLARDTRSWALIQLHNGIAQLHMG